MLEEFERAAKTERTLKQVQMFWTGYTTRFPANALFETFREYLSDWLMAKKAETASSTVDDGQTSLRKLVQFLGQRVDEPIGEITKQDIVAVRLSSVGQVVAKTVSHDLKARKMLFKSALRRTILRRSVWIRREKVHARIAKETEAEGLSSQAQFTAPDSIPLQINGLIRFRNSNRLP